jgi:competence protein ComEC
MARLAATIIDVGWGDSIFIEMEDDNGESSYGLIDSNDSKYLKSSYIFIKRFFERRRIERADGRFLFDFVILSHAHSDHGQGLRYLMKKYGTKRFLYSKTRDWGALAYLLRFCRRSSNVRHHESLHTGKEFPAVRGVNTKILWPPPDYEDSNKNNHSVVMQMTLGEVSFVFTGDAEEEVWEHVAGSIPADTGFLKVPHHGSNNGSLDSQGNPVWLRNCPRSAKLGISCHGVRYGHPDPEVMRCFDDYLGTANSYRTDQFFHLTFETDGRDVTVKYTH